MLVLIFIDATYDEKILMAKFSGITIAHFVPSAMQNNINHIINFAKPSRMMLTYKATIKQHTHMHAPTQTHTHYPGRMMTTTIHFMWKMMCKE